MGRMGGEVLLPDNKAEINWNLMHDVTLSTKS